MADQFVIDPPNRGWFAPAALDVVVGILGLAEDCPPTRDLLAHAVERLSRAFEPAIAVGLLLDPSVPSDIFGDERTPHDQRGDLIQALVRSASLLVVSDGSGTRTGDGRDAARLCASLASQGSWLTSHTELGDQTAVVGLHYPGPPTGQSFLLAEALDRVLTALAARFRLARQRQRRIERFETLTTMLADITSHLNVHRVLQTIVEQARALVSADATYLADVDESSHLVTMRVTTGINDTGYKRGTVELGKGMAGLAAATRRVMVTGDYLTDPRFVHTIETDANVSREGVRGAIVAPLSVGKRVIGVLGVVNRRPTQFSPDDVHLVTSLADGAAIAIENARLYEEQMGLIERLRELNELTTRQHESLKRTMQVHDQLTELVLQGHGIETIALRLSALIANPVVVLGPYFNLRVVAGADPARAIAIADRLEARRAPAHLAAALDRLAIERRPIHLAPDPTYEIDAPIILAPILAGADRLGYLLAIEAQGEFDALDFQAMEQASTVFAVELTRERVVAEAENRLRGDFMHGLVTGTLGSSAIARRAAGLGHDLTLPQLILVVAPDPNDGTSSPRSDAPEGDQLHSLERALRLSSHRRAVMAQTAVIGDVVVTLLALSSQTGSERARAVVADLRAELGSLPAPATHSIGVSRIHRTPVDLAAAYREALQALRTGQRLGRRGAVTEFECLGVERLLAQVPDAAELARYVDAVLGLLIAYDIEHKTDLLNTLETHLAHGCHQRTTASTLGIHVNSLQYRLRRIEGIGELCLDDPETRLNLQLALRTRQVIRSTES